MYMYNVRVYYRVSYTGEHPGIPPQLNDYCVVVHTYSCGEKCINGGPVTTESEPQQAHLEILLL